MSLNVAANNASRMVGPAIGGLLLASVGIAGVFPLSMALYGLALLAAFRVRYHNTALVGPAPVLTRIASGLQLVSGEPRLNGTQAVTLIFNVIGWPFTSIISAIGQNRLGPSAQGPGALASVDGVDASSGLGGLAALVLTRQLWRHI